MRRALAAAVAAMALGAVPLLAACTSGGTATATGTGPTANPTAGTAQAQAFPETENLLPGTGAWRITDQGGPDAIEGYASAQSVLPGQPFQLFASTTSKSFRVEAFRFGWYQGNQARLVWTSPPVPGRQQAGPGISAGTHL